MTPFDVYRLPNGNILCDTGDTGLIEHDAFGVPGRGHVDLAEGAVKLTPESEGLEPLLATNRRLHDEIRSVEVERDRATRRYEAAEEKCEEWFASYERVRGELAEAKAGVSSDQYRQGWEAGSRWQRTIGTETPELPDRMRAAADVLEEATKRHLPDIDPENVEYNAWDAAGLHSIAAEWEVEDRERAETEQRVTELGKAIETAWIANGRVEGYPQGVGMARNLMQGWEFKRKADDA